jgi:riboflavin transporter FmnP
MDDIDDKNLNDEIVHINKGFEDTSKNIGIKSEQCVVQNNTNEIKATASKGVDGCVKTKTSSKRRFVIGYITKVAILSSLSVVLYMFARFPIFASFPFNVLEMDFASIPSLLGGFALGPIAGVLIELIKCTIKLTTTNTLFIGELSNFIVSTAFVLPSTAIYKYSKYKKTKKGAIIGLLVGVFMNVVIASLSNYFVIIPLYGIAFNLIKSVSVSIITFLLYKRVSKPLHL